MTIFKDKFPNAKFIILIRDGRGVVDSQIRSYYKYPPGHLQHASHWMKPTVKEAESVWLNAMNRLFDISRRIPKERFEIIKYEYLVTNTYDVFGVLTNFLELEQPITNIDDYYKPTNICTWRENHPNMMSLLSDEFKKRLEGCGYE